MQPDDMKGHIKQVFKVYCELYDKALNSLHFEPWNEPRHTIHESNQVRTFMEAYKSKVDDVITWMELPVSYNGGTAHIDGYIADLENKSIIFIEAKRFSRESQIDSLQKDVKRIYELNEEIYGKELFKGLKLSDFDVYTLFLADIWEERGEWAVKLAKEWKPKDKLDCGKEKFLDNDIKRIMTIRDAKNVSSGYYLTYTLASYFNVAAKD